MRQNRLPAGTGLNLVVLAVLLALVAAPLLKILMQTQSPDSIGGWRYVLASPLSPDLFWRPAANTMILGIGVAAGCVLIGGFLAWLVVMTDVPSRGLIGFVATLPFRIPNFDAALASVTVSRNGRVGGGGGLLEGWGSFSTVSGKGGHACRFTFSGARLPLAGEALRTCVLTTIVPILLLIAARLVPMASALFADWTLARLDRGC
ncbi:hypothetical protein [Loktanella fryxellensis]|uniref:hypothetical protein n=1 Tax=Loktanella fryxellensis TaxID=245187 RepID=UPI000B7DE986|nr:hypothetical protein [Loktanella fryxellensis]